MKKPAIVLLMIFITALAGTFYYFSGKEYVIRLSESDLQSKLEEKLPLTNTYLFIIQITLENPRVHLENGSTKVGAGLDVIFNITVGKNPRPLGGTIDVSGGVVYLEETGQFFLTEPVIENLIVQGVPSKYTKKVNTALSKALAEYYKTNPIYSLSSLDMKQTAAKLVLKNVIVENQELVVTLGI